MPLSRRTFNTLLLATTAASALPLSAEPVPAFVHPGMLHNRADLDRMRQAVAAKTQPIYDGFEIMRKHPASSATYKSAGASAEIGRNPNVRFQFFDQDANAAYQCALMWSITGDKACSATAIAILNDWSAKLKKISGLDAILCASLGGFKIANAAELMRHTGAGWRPADAERFGKLLTEVFLPVIANFAAFANGNWDTAVIKLMLAIAIYTDDRPLFDRAIDYYLHGCGDGRLEHYIYASGQCQESGRDQQHTQLGLAHMGDACEMAWHQGLDLYAALDNRLLLGFEYTAKYGLGGDVPFVPDIDRTGKYRHAVNSERSPLRAVYEQIYNHYTRRRGIPTPWTQKAAEKLRPEGAPFQADATGYGTLLYTRPAGVETRDPALRPQTVLHAAGSAEGIVVSALPFASGSAIHIERADAPRSAWRPLARNITAGIYTDRTAEPGRLYSYRAIGASGLASSAVAAMRGLPQGWQTRNEGRLNASASFDGVAFSLIADGAQPVDQGGSFFSVEHSIPPTASLTARLSPLVASSFVGLGIVLRDTASGSSTLLHISPRGGPQEHPAWSAALLTRTGATETRLIGDVPLSAPVIVDGRLSSALWLRLQIAAGVARAAVSTNATDWTEVAHVPVSSGPLSLGLFAHSGIETIATEVRFEQVTLAL